MTQELLDLEEHFWTGNAEYYDRHLSDDAIMVFPDPVGVMTRDAIVASIGESARWREVKISEVRLTNVTADSVLITYRAAASRGGAEPRYAALASSLYVRDTSAWRLAFHQQTPGNPW